MNSSRGDQNRIMLVGYFSSRTEDHLSLAFDDEHDHIRIVMYRLAKLSHGRNTDDHQFAEGSGTNCLRERPVFSCCLLDVFMERLNRRFCV